MTARPRAVADARRRDLYRAAAVSRNHARYRGRGRDWSTPAAVFEPLDAEFGFTLDPCATAANAKVARFYTEADDGLTRPWAPDRVFLNPPWGAELAAWIHKARREAAAGALVVALLPASTDRAWFHDDILAAGAEVRWIRGRVRFVAADGRSGHPFGSQMVVVWRPGPVR